MRNKEALVSSRKRERGDAVGRFLRAVAAGLLCLTCTARAAATERASSYRAALESITAGELQHHVDYLADDALEGREAGSRGGREAADYLAEQLHQLQLRGGGVDGGYFQPFAPNYRNLLAMLPGSDPELKNQVLVVGAHYDHVGYGAKYNSRGPIGQIHNGADDNASGTSGLLELAQALTMLPQGPKRSILLVFWDAEEKGMLGSRHWIAQPTVPLDRVAAMVNLDMIGHLRDDHLIVFGSRSGVGWRRLLCTHNDGLGLNLDFSWSMDDLSDHSPFFERNIPVLLLTTGEHADYHRPTDDASRIDHAGMRRVVQLLFGLLCDLADAPQTPRFRPLARRETEKVRQQLAERASAPASTYRTGPPQSPPTLDLDGKPLRLGITWRVDDAEPGTIVLTYVVPGSPAAQAGLTPGDHVYQIAGRDFADDAEFARLAASLPDPLELLVERDGQLRTVVLHFRTEPMKRAA